MINFFKSYGDFLNENLKDNLGKPQTISKVDIYKPKSGNDKNKYRIINPITKRPIEIGKYLDIINDIQILSNKKNLTDEERKRLLSYSKYKENTKEVERVAKIVSSFIGKSLSNTDNEKTKKEKKDVQKSVTEIEKINKLSDQKIKTYYERGFVKGSAPGNPGSMLNENGSNHAAFIFFNKNINENDVVLELYNNLKGGELLKQQASNLPSDIKKSEIKKIKESDSRLANIPDNQLARIILAVRSGKIKAKDAEKSADVLKWDKKDCLFQGFFGDKDGLEAQRSVVKNATRILAPDGSEISLDEALYYINNSGRSSNPSDTAQFLTNKKTGEVVIFFTSDKDSIDAIIANSSFSSENQNKIKMNKELVASKKISEKQSENANNIINKYTKMFVENESKLQNIAGMPVNHILKNNLDKILNVLKTMGTKWHTAADKYYHLIIKKAKNPEEEKKQLQAFLDKAKNEPDKLTKVEIKVLSKLKDAMNIKDEDTSIAIEKVRKDAINIEMQMKEELNKIKIKVNGKDIGLGDYYNAVDVIEKMHLGGALGKKEGIFSRPGLFKTIYGSISLNDEELKSCLNVDNINDFILRFGSEPDSYQLNTEGRITGFSRIVYFLDESGNKIRIAEKRQRSKKGEMGSFSTVYKWADDIKKCFKSKYIKENKDFCETCKNSNFNF